MLERFVSQNDMLLRTYIQKCDSAGRTYLNQKHCLKRWNTPVKLTDPTDYSQSMATAYSYHYLLYTNMKKAGQRRVHQYCQAGRIPGVSRFGRSWAIPADTPKPTDPRKENTRRK